MSCSLCSYIFSVSRVLLASTRDKGQCPCSHCLMPLKKVHNLGTVTDMKQRETLARVDDDARKAKISAARKIIYDKDYAVNNDASESMLKDQSLVATKVRLDPLVNFTCTRLMMTLCITRTPSPKN